jgi:hypothetical protein
MRPDYLVVGCIIALLFVGVLLDAYMVGREHDKDEWDE